MAAGSATDRTAFATWSRRTALFALQLALIAVVLHRFASLPTPVMINMVIAALAGAGLALVLGSLAIIRIWRRGGTGVTAAAAGFLVALGLLAWPLFHLPAYLNLPHINDITTDLEAPPRFEAIAKWRPEGANPLAYPGARFASLQSEHYPDVKTLIVSRAAAEAFELTREIVRRRGWLIVALRPPAATGGDAVGEIEATEQTLIMGYHDDIVIRLKGERSRTHIDVRSASRYGRTDLGRNAERVRALVRELYARIDLGVALEKEEGLDRRRRIRRKPPADESLSQQQAPTLPASQRVRGPRVEPRRPNENQARDRRR